jgi:predicted small lipoprotein YifL
MKHVLALALITLALASCGVRGDPQPPAFVPTQTD